jgi:hypothetical protein
MAFINSKHNHHHRRVKMREGEEGGIVALVCSVHLLFLLSCPHGLRKVLEHGLRIVPSDTGVGDTDAVFESGFAFWGYFLAA